MPEVISVPTISGSAPYFCCDGTHSLEKTKSRTPYFAKTGRASSVSRMKKNAISSRIAAASPVSVHFRRRSGSRDSDDRPEMSGRPPCVSAPAAMGCRSAPRDRLAVALQAVDLGRGLRLQRGGQRRVLELLRDLLARVLAVLEPRDDGLGLLLVAARLADVLVDEQERDGRDRVRLVARRVDRREAQVVRDRDALGGGGRGRERRLDVVAGLVLHRRVGEVVGQRVRLLDVADGALVLLDAGGDAVVALGARARRP